MKARLLRYAPLQLMDYAVERGAVTLGMGFLMGLIFVLGASTGQSSWAQGAKGLEAVQLFFLSTLGVFTWFGVLAAVNGMISNDRVKGTVRFLFSKPLSVLQYYVQAWVVHGIGLLLVVSTLLALFALFVRPFFPPGIFLFVIVTYVLLGGIGFLLSAITKRDGTLLVATWLLALALRGRYANEPGAVGSVVRIVTPPANELSAMMTSIIRSGPIDTSMVIAALVYGAICFALGLAVLRYRPMTT